MEEEERLLRWAYRERENGRREIEREREQLGWEERERERERTTRMGGERERERMIKVRGLRALMSEISPSRVLWTF